MRKMGSHCSYAKELLPTDLVTHKSPKHCYRYCSAPPSCCCNTTAARTHNFKVGEAWLLYIIRRILPVMAPFMCLGRRVMKASSPERGHRSLATFCWTRVSRFAAPQYTIDKYQGMCAALLLYLLPLGRKEATETGRKYNLKMDKTFIWMELFWRWYSNAQCTDESQYW